MTPTATNAVAYAMTPSGRGAVATICLRGDIALLDGHVKYPPAFQPARGGQCADLPLRDVVFGCWGEQNCEEVVVCRVDSNSTEIHCHGGRAAVERILADLRLRGCEVITWVEHLSATATTLEAECVEALTRATTLRTSQHLLVQQQGALAARLSALLASDDEALRSGIDDLLQWSDFGLHLTSPWSVVLCGRPNVGKSSLINALVGYRRAIVYDEPGTTRDVVEAETALEGWPICFSDTAGLREGADELEQRGIAKAREQMESADLLITVIDSSQPVTDDDRQLLADHSQSLAVLSKCDLPRRADVSDLMVGSSQIWPVSAVRGTGMDELQRMIVRRLVPTVPDLGAPIPFTQRQVDGLRNASDAESNDEARQWIHECLNGAS